MLSILCSIFKLMRLEQCTGPDPSPSVFSALWPRGPAGEERECQALNEDERCLENKSLRWMFEAGFKLAMLPHTQAVTPRMGSPISPEKDEDLRHGIAPILSQQCPLEAAG